MQICELAGVFYETAVSEIEDLLIRNIHFYIKHVPLTISDMALVLAKLTEQ